MTPEQAKEWTVTGLTVATMLAIGFVVLALIVRLGMAIWPG